MRISLLKFLEIRRELNKISDLEKFSYPRGLLHAILIQKKVESVKKRYHRFLERSSEILEFWRNERRFPAWLTLPPAIKVRILLKTMNFTAKEISKAMRNPETVEELEDVIRSAIYKDFVYSPIATKLQTIFGKIGEKILAEKLKELGIKFKTEKELKTQKTPDFYFDEEIEIFGKKMKWIESKALFADLKTFEIYNKKQILKYKQLFGDGIAVYWRGALDGLDVSDGSEFKSSLRDKLLKMRIYVDKEMMIDGDAIEVAEKIVEGYIEENIFPYHPEAMRILKNMGLDVKILCKN